MSVSAEVTVCSERLQVVSQGKLQELDVFLAFGCFLSEARLNCLRHGARPEQRSTAARVFIPAEPTPSLYTRVFSNKSLGFVVKP